jgi:hypothetical protein
MADAYARRDGRLDCADGHDDGLSSWLVNYDNLPQ